MFAYPVQSEQIWLHLLFGWNDPAPADAIDTNKLTLDAELSIVYGFKVKVHVDNIGFGVVHLPEVHFFDTKPYNQ